MNHLPLVLILFCGCVTQPVPKPAKQPAMFIRQSSDGIASVQPDVLLIPDTSNPELFHIAYAPTISISNLYWSVASSSNLTDWSRESVGFDGMTITVFLNGRSQLFVAFKGTTANQIGATQDEIPAQARFRKLTANPVEELNLVGAVNLLISP